MQWIDALSYEEVMTFLRSTPANLFFKDTECRYLFISDVRTFFPYGEGQEEDVLGKTDLEIWGSEEQARFYYEQDQKVLATGKGTSFITEVPRKDGTAYYQIKKNPVVLEGKIIGIVGLIGDITERVRLEKQAQNWAVHDELTGLYNRNYLKVKGAEQLKGAIMPITIIMGDCNYLKRVNDAYGHEYGDLLLKRVGRVIRENLPPESVALRMGGDEFLIACSHFSAEEAEQLIERLHGELARQSDDRLKLDVAFGYHTVTEGPFDYTAVYHAADRDMYRNKRKTAENPDEITASARSPRAEAVLVICYIRAVSTSAQSGRMRMLSRVVSTTDPAAKCSSWPNCTANTEVMAAAGQHSSRSTTWADIPNRSRPSAAKAARQTAGMSSIRTPASFQMCLSRRMLPRSPDAIRMPVMSMDRGVFMPPSSSNG